MKKPVITAILATLPLLATNALAGDAAAGKAKAATCIACHGPAGISNNNLWPNLAGQKKGYLIKQLKDFRAGKRNDPLMKPMVQNLTDADIENLAEYFSSLKSQ
ncbi:cytochrome c [bacterium SCSIO 12696]|nr:cytochrome c [bacterium SCSIO 12696]